MLRFWSACACHVDTYIPRVFDSGGDRAHDTSPWTFAASPSVFLSSCLFAARECRTLNDRPMKPESAESGHFFPGTERRDHQPRPGPGRRDEEAGGQHPAPGRTPPGPPAIPGPYSSSCLPRLAPPCGTRSEPGLPTMKVPVAQVLQLGLCGRKTSCS